MEPMGFLVMLIILTLVFVSYDLWKINLTLKMIADILHEMSEDRDEKGG